MEGYFGGRGRIAFEDSIFLPFCLVFLLNSYKGISLLSLEE
jgi:hypothetical protein